MTRDTVKKWVIFGCIGFCIAGASAAAASLYAAHAHDPAFDPQLVLGVHAFTAYVVVQNVDAEQRTVDLLVASPAAGQNVTMRVKLAREFYIERRDAIIENGVIVGAQPSKRAILDDLNPGVRGIGLLRLWENGETTLQYIVIGDPFTRP